MPAHLKNEIDNEYGLLTVVSRAKSIKGRSHWNCKCKCGGFKPSVSANSLRTGGTISCGCQKKGPTPSKYTPPEMLAKRRAAYQELKDLPY